MEGQVGESTPITEQWVDVVGVDELRRRRKIVVPAGPGGEGDGEGGGGGPAEVLVLLHDGAVHAFDNICIHRQRELVKGTVLNGRLICPGHQWAFELGTGWEAIKGECQPTYAVRIEDGRVLLDLASRARRAPITPPG
jgi:nitrite reductase (NADH) small subunit